MSSVNEIHARVMLLHDMICDFNTAIREAYFRMMKSNEKFLAPIHVKVFNGTVDKETLLVLQNSANDTIDAGYKMLMLWQVRHNAELNLMVEKLLGINVDLSQIKDPFQRLIDTHGNDMDKLATLFNE